MSKVEEFMTLLQRFDILGDEETEEDINELKTYLEKAVHSYETRLELECKCKLCKTAFVIYNLEKIIDVVDGGFHISGLSCPNCDQKDLDFDIMRRKNYE